ncbi:MAG: ABC transporter permease [Bacteroidales bacterium]|nr:ABC transporter permease [Bacteroidales bacterium]
MNTNLFIAKTLWSNGSHKGGLGKGSAIIAGISVAVSVMVMVLAISISDGFKKEIKEKAAGFSGELLLHSPGTESTTNLYPISSNLSFLDEIEGLREVSSIQPYAYRSAIIKSEDQIQGVLVKGVDSGFNWNFFNSVIHQGRVPNVSDSLKQGEIMISLRLAKMLDFKVGDELMLYFIDNNVKIRKFTLTGIYNAQLEDIDKSLIITSLSQIQSVNGWSEQELSGIEIKLKKGFDIKKSSVLVEDIIDNSEEDESVFVTRVDELFPHLFDWLTLLDFNVLVVMLLMLSVAGFNMISGLLILLFEKISMIGLLKALGMKDSGIHKVFLIRAIYLVITGMFAGNIIALILASIQKRFEIIPLDPVNYFVDHVPIFINWSKIGVLNAGALLLITLLLMIPSFFIAKVSPEKTLRVK